MTQRCQLRRIYMNVMYTAGGGGGGDPVHSYIGSPSELPNYPHVYTKDSIVALVLEIGWGGICMHGGSVSFGGYIYHGILMNFQCPSNTEFTLAYYSI